MKLNTRVSPDIEALSRAALEQVLADMQEAVKLRGRFAIALSGGHTPSKMYALWAQNDKYRTATPWDRVYIFWGDERYVPADDPLIQTYCAGVPVVPPSGKPGGVTPRRPAKYGISE